MGRHCGTLRFPLIPRPVPSGNRWDLAGNQRPNPKHKNPMTAQSTVTKSEICAMLRAFVAQRSGLDWRNYASDWHDSTGMSALQSDRNRILQHGRDARTLLTFVEHSPMPVDFIVHELKGGRLTFDSSRHALDYCAGQYFPTEYRVAVCRTLANAIWRFCRNNVKPDVRTFARETFGRGIASRWFN